LQFIENEHQKFSVISISPNITFFCIAFPQTKYAIALSFLYAKKSDVFERFNFLASKILGAEQTLKTIDVRHNTEIDNKFFITRTSFSIKTMPQKKRPDQRPVNIDGKLKCVAEIRYSIAG
jgi:hypothetical protein